LAVATALSCAVALQASPDHEEPHHHDGVSAQAQYVHMVGTSLVTSNNTYLQTGWYSMDGDGVGDDPDWTNANFVGSYYFGQTGETWRPIILGGFGLSDITQDNVRVDGANSDTEMDSWYSKIGGGINYNPNENLGLVLAASGCWMNSDASYDMNGGTPSDALRKYFGEDSDSAIYDVFASANYHWTTEEGYKPYFEGVLHYLSLDFDHDVDTVDGWNTDLTAGVYTPSFTEWYDMPVRAHLFAAATLFDDDLEEVTHFDSVYHAGASLLWHVGPLFDDYFNGAFHRTEVALNVLGSLGDNDLSGFKVSASFFIAKY
jgi:hypothetical protein